MDEITPALKLAVIENLLWKRKKACPEIRYLAWTRKWHMVFVGSPRRVQVKTLLLTGSVTQGSSSSLSWGFFICKRGLIDY